MVLSREEIRRLLLATPPLLESYRNLDEQIQPNGFDLTVREIAAYSSGGSIGAGKERATPNLCALSFSSSKTLDLPPGSYLVTYNEVVHLPLNLMALGRPRSTLLRCGVHIGTAVWDAGYSGRSQSLLVVHNPHGFRIAQNARIMQLVFIYLHSPASQGYSGIYQNENTDDPGTSRSH